MAGGGGGDTSPVQREAHPGTGFAIQRDDTLFLISGRRACFPSYIDVRVRCVCVLCVCASFVRASICPFQLVTGVVLLAFLLFRSLYIQCIDCALYSFLAVVFHSSSFLYSPSLGLLPFLLPIRPSYSVPLILRRLELSLFSLTSLCLCAFLFFISLSRFSRFLLDIIHLFFSLYTHSITSNSLVASHSFFSDVIRKYPTSYGCAATGLERETLTHLPIPPLS